LMCISWDRWAIPWMGDGRRDRRGVFHAPGHGRVQGHECPSGVCQEQNDQCGPHCGRAFPGSRLPAHRRRTSSIWPHSKGDMPEARVLLRDFDFEPAPRRMLERQDGLRCIIGPRIEHHRRQYGM
jgi:hypothetical protein